MKQEIYPTIKSAVFGHAVGDALGVPVEFATRERLQCTPVQTMQGFQTHNVPPGTWSDDTSMTLCTLESLTKTGNVNLNDMMDRFIQWGYAGYMTPYGRMFGIGRTTRLALTGYRRGKPVDACGGTQERDNGNGSLMRIMPVILYQHMTGIYGSEREKMEELNRVSALTHGHPRAMMACGIYGFVLDELLARREPSSLVAGLKQAALFYAGSSEYSAYTELFQPDFFGLDSGQIQSSGYVVDTLKAALWCVGTTTSYPECVLKAVNLGGDTDTTAAVAGGLAGVLYGFDSIPKEWISSLALHEKLDAMCMDAAERWTEPCC